MSRQGMGILQSVYGMQQNNTTFNGITIGFVVDTNDPQQMGRVRAVCPALNDPSIEESFNVQDIPWASYCSEFGGIMGNIKRGPEENQSEGPVSYGMWNIPKTGSQVVVMCLDGDPSYRVYLGCLHGQFLPHTMPSGRYLGENNDGPLTTSESPIEPLYSNLSAAYGDKTGFEWKTRGADYQAAGIKASQLSHTASSQVDDRDNNRGYAPDAASDDPLLLDNQVFSWTTPGFHSIAMDDRPNNCRMKFRTTTGHQIILDDTNERIFISTSKANVWVEMDSAGNLDIHSERFMSFHSGKDMNFTADGALRFRGKEGIHMISEDEVRIHSVADTHIQSDSNVRVKASSDVFTEGSNLNLSGSGDVMVTASGTLHGKGSAGANIEGGGNVGILAGGQALITGSAVHLNGPPAPPATDASPAESLFAYATNRVPFNIVGGKTWSRGMLSVGVTDTDSANIVAYDDYSNFEFPYESDNVGKVELGEPIQRNKNWRR